MNFLFFIWISSNVNFTFEVFDFKDQKDIHMRWTKWITRLNRYAYTICRYAHTKTTEIADKLNALLMFGVYDLEQIYNEKFQETNDYATATETLGEHFNPTTS